MTLAITVISYHGVWQATDHRLSRAEGTVTDDSIKHVKFKARDGSAMLAYAGVGRVGTIDISDWVRKLVRGDYRTIREQVNILCNASARKLAPHCRRAKTPLTFSIGGFESGEPTLYTITNRVRKPYGDIVSKRFYGRQVTLRDAPQNAVGVHVEGSGANALQPNKLLEFIQGIVRRRAGKPSFWEDMMGALAETIKRASEDRRSGGSVSKQSVVTCLPSPQAAFMTRFYGWPLDVPWPEVPHLIGAVDVKAASEIIRPIRREFDAKFRQPNANKQELEDALRDRCNEILSQSDLGPTDKI